LAEQAVGQVEATGAQAALGVPGPAAGRREWGECRLKV